MPAPVSPALFDQFARGWRGYVLIALIALLSSQFGAARTPVWDADEARFAQATRQMVESGDYIRIRLQDAERNRKPAGAHWLQAAAVRTFSPDRLNAIWPYRLPSALGLMLAALATLWGGTALLGQRSAFLGAALLAASMLAGYESAVGKADALLLGFTTLAMAALAHLRAGDARPRLMALVFWIALACGVLTKGPVTPLVATLTLAALALWERRVSWMRQLLWWPGPLLALLLLAPWVLAINAATEGRFFADMLFGDVLPKVLSGDEGHFALPGYHLLLLPLLIFPATYALPAAARLALGALRAPRGEATQAPLRFLLAWAAPTFLLFELLPTKLPHYPLPTYPAIALLCGAGLMAMRGRGWRTSHPLGLVFFGVAGGVLVSAMAVGSMLMLGDLDADLRRAVSTALFAALPVAAAIFGLLLLRRPAARTAVLVACALVLAFSLREQLLPEARLLFVSNEATAALARARLLPREDRALWVVGYDEASIVFLTRTSTRLAAPEQAAAGARAGDAMVIEGRVLRQTMTALAARGLAFAQAEPAVRGYALGRGASVALLVGEARVASGETGADAPVRTP
jgi:4-amino-4-deoxy-L-arabinose transferase-like glycosyltransferase